MSFPDSALASFFSRKERSFSELVFAMADEIYSLVWYRRILYEM